MFRAISLGFVVAVIAAPAFANQTEDNCKAYSAKNNTDPSGCACLGAEAAKDSALADALAKINTPEDVQAADDATKQAIAQCWPQPETPKSGGQ